MIVDPDFFDHWRTRMVADLLGGDALAPVYVMRLWAHCQNRKSDTFAIPSSGLKALCHFQGDAGTLEEALIAAEYLLRDGPQVTVIGWAQKNAQLIAAWENGARGGRPRKEPTARQSQPQGQPKENPRETDPKPLDIPGETDKRREEERREEESSDPIGSLSASQLTGGQSRLDDLLEVEVRPCAKPAVPPCPYDALLALYHELCPTMPGVRADLFKTGKRADAMLARWKWVLTGKAQSGERMATTREEGEAWFRRFFGYVAESPFLRGDHDGRPWCADLGWLMNRGNFEKVMEGKYHGERQEIAYA